MNPMVSNCETTMPNVLIESTDLMGRDPAGIELPTSTMNSELTSSSFSLLMSHELLPPYKQMMGEFEAMSNHLNLQQYAVPNREAEQFLCAGLGEEKLPFLNKRKAAELRPLSPSLPNMSVVNKRAAFAGSSPTSPGVLQPTTQNKRTEVQSKAPRTTASRKKMMQIDPVLSKSQSTVSKNQNMQSEASSGFDTGKMDPIRAKLRESLTAALALVSEQKASSLNDDKTKEMAEVPVQNGETKPAISVSSTAIGTDVDSAPEGYGSSSICPTNNFSVAKSGSQELLLKDVSGEDWKFLGQDFQSNPIFPGEDAPFGESLFFRDELLQGNGLSWDMDFDAQIAEMEAVESTRKNELAHEAGEQDKKQADLSPESVAVRIETELFTLFGGVNKKYKEKGRSLLFNLKDRNNPELRERVMSGEISPDRLCTMTAEELASKELSQWRMAKAEELDQMKVLPDSEVDVRRLVKKTHKGEYQVEFDQDISVVEDIPASVSVTHAKAKRKESGGVGRHSRGDAAKEHGTDPCTITIPGDGTDMQGLMVDDMRDLPPILSLDEFMDSLDKEPPFDSLPVDSRRTPELDNNIPEDRAESKSPVLPSDTPSMSISEKNEAVDEESVQCGGENETAPGATFLADQIKRPSEANVMAEPINRPSKVNIMAEQIKGPTEANIIVEQIKRPSEAIIMAEQMKRPSEASMMAKQIKEDHLWEGLLQLSGSSAANVVAIYKSGERASTREWPRSFEIKGRVRLDAFDKFLQELPKSRTRATMVVHFALAVRSTDEERCNLIDLIDSYVTDQRLGYAEPAPGVELYVCPPRSKTIDMIVKHLPKAYTEKLSDIDNGLIGVLVWRKEQIPSATLPNPSSQHKHTTFGQHSMLGRQLSQKDMNRNVNSVSRANLPPPTLSKPAPKNNDDNDDVPPGFGPPGGAREDDDLPEFNFSAGSNVSRFPTPKVLHPPPVGSLRPEVPSRQVEQMRALIQKYGKSGESDVNGIPIQPWNDDEDDDDIPEWQPQTAHHQPPNMPPGFPAQTSILHSAGRPSFQQPGVRMAKPMPSVQPSISTHGPWRHPGPNIVQPAGSPRGRGPTPGAQFFAAPVTGRQNRGRRPSHAYSGNRGV